MSEAKKATIRLEQGNQFPYDATDYQRENWPDVPFTAATDWAQYAARGVLADLTDRRGIKRGFEEIDEDVRLNIVACLAGIIRAAPREFEVVMAEADKAKHQQMTDLWQSNGGDA